MATFSILEITVEDMRPHIYNRRDVLCLFLDLCSHFFDWSWDWRRLKYQDCCSSPRLLWQDRNGVRCISYIVIWHDARAIYSAWQIFQDSFHFLLRQWQDKDNDKYMKRTPMVSQLWVCLLSASSRSRSRRQTRSADRQLNWSHRCCNAPRYLESLTNTNRGAS